MSDLQSPPIRTSRELGESRTSPPHLEPFRITLAPLLLNEVYQAVDAPAHGAIVIMSGMVRNQTDHRPVVALEYQAYEPMAIRVFQGIADQIRQRWPSIQHVAIHHRIGYLEVGDISVLVAIGAPHRAEAFAAGQYAIDTLKHEAPIWKKEHWGDGSSSWVSIANCESLHGSSP
ncbi:molybdenum cofactor biosynthesis protein MoaE [Lyngbya confervoides]|uniref:Molybdenum cofactor biosynthesis protein MoaE n=1 Tax=Lyngbya confervoides BDU141951 TaxID=1574623 RepID=A0ABD4T2T1_9CYAN|nr:molybdenum cofactor biosynthesis protein MoaE [Lyngbya confervoides]MCM1982723.1 molybdenum cofactor biosynthesis protein MoaE [Lyngbya confervoides BDU141951]